MQRIRENILAFINSDKDVPLLAGFSVGFYMMLFYYSRNFGMANSPGQIIFFTGYYFILPMVCIYGIYKLLGSIKLSAYRKHFLFVAIVGFTAFYLLQINHPDFSKKIIFAIILLVAGLLSFWLKKYYKLLIVLLFLMSVFNVKPIAGIIWRTLTADYTWQAQPDDIENIVFKDKPNIYYIQPDGYASPENLRNEIYGFDNRDFEGFLEKSGFSLYNNYRSNYPSTLLSNAATFSMKQHYIAEYVNAYATRGIIADNPVLRILKKNGYKTNLIIQTPYIIMNRPTLQYDFCNIKYSDLPYLGDGFGFARDVDNDLKMQMKQSGTSGNFYFIEKFIPGHISNTKKESMGVAEQRDVYLKRLERANKWLKNLIIDIEQNDPGSLIIIGADHGGFVGFESTNQSRIKTSDERLVNSIFGASLAIKWPEASSAGYDKGLKTGVNLFRTIFSFLAHDKKYLEHLQDNSSYMRMDDPKGTHRYIDDKGNVVFDKI